MSNRKDGISGTRSGYPAEALVQYSTDSFSTMASQLVTSTNYNKSMVSVTNMEREILQVNVC